MGGYQGVLTLWRAKKENIYIYLKKNGGLGQTVGRYLVLMELVEPGGSFFLVVDR